MPDRFGDANFQTLAVDVIPAKCQEFTDPQAGCRIEERQSALSNGKLAEEELEFAQFENVRNFLPLRAFTDELDRISFDPLVTHRVMQERVLIRFRIFAFVPLARLMPPSHSSTATGFTCSRRFTVEISCGHERHCSFERRRRVAPVEITSAGPRQCS